MRVSKRTRAATRWRTESSCVCRRKMCRPGPGSDVSAPSTLHSHNPDTCGKTACSSTKRNSKRNLTRTLTNAPLITERHDTPHHPTVKWLPSPVPCKQSLRRTLPALAGWSSLLPAPSYRCAARLSESKGRKKRKKKNQKNEKMKTGKSSSNSPNQSLNQPIFHCTKLNLLKYQNQSDHTRFIF